MAGLIPLSTQGNLNRVATHVVCSDFPQLSVTASFMAKSQAVITFEGPFVDQLPTATGVVNSPKPFVQATIVINMLRSQALSNLWQNQVAVNATIGTVEVYPDSSTLQPYLLSNCSIQNIEPGPFDGADPTVKVTVMGTFYSNSVMWANLTGSLVAQL